VNTSNTPQTLTGLIDLASFTVHEEGALLVAVEGPALGATIVVNASTIVLGSSSGCDLVLRDSRVSRRHAQLTWTGRCLQLNDLESKNGTYHDGERVDQADLSFGAEFQLGTSVFKVVPNQQALDPTPAASPKFGALVGASGSMRKLFTMIEQVASADIPVLIEGETGVGKELVAEEIHRRSPRRDRPFVVFDCGAIPTELIESALFGHVRGSFTGAATDRPGIFDEAAGGTVFLDEIGELRLDLQPTLLRVLDRGMVRRVGETRFHDVDVRIVAATHRSLGVMVGGGQFREDLYYRLAVSRLTVPALRDRAEDVELLARHFLQRSGRPDLTLRADDADRLTRHTWPGNVRELRNTIDRGIAFSVNGAVRIDGLDRPTTPQNDTDTPEPPGERKPFREAKAEATKAFERDYLTSLMAEFDTVTAAATAAGMDRKHLRVLLKRYGLHKP